ncbi:MAG TPA: S41 family peptidase [Polyangiaceae bacterium]|nr:S41 family peptidase [Polyangiaceae bacterium]
MPTTPTTPARSVPRKRFRVLWPLLLTLSAFTGGALTSNLGRAALDTGPYSVLDQLARVLVLIENEYVDPVDRDRLLNGAIKGMVAELDPHSAYLPARDFAVLQDDTRGEFAGIGVEVDFRNDRVTVISAIDGSPAQRAGMLPGDLIVSIDGLSVSGKNASDLVKAMRGPAGTVVRVAVRRPGKEELLRFSLSRQVIEVSSVLGADLAGQIAYLRIKQFQSKTDAELLQAIGEVRRHMGDIRGVLLDLRNNPGGLVAAASAVADEFLAGGAVYSTRHRGKVVNEVHAGSSGALQDCPMVVLVNEFSASASELLAGALQDHKRATIIGARTFGKGSVQSIIDLPAGGGLRLTTMRYYTPGGRAIQVEGIVPDVAVESTLSDGGNAVLREYDLENHLPSEAAEPSQPSAPTAQANTPPPSPDTEQPGISPTHLGVARSVPHDPTGGPDHALSVAYTYLRDALGSRPPARATR